MDTTLSLDTLYRPVQTALNEVTEAVGKLWTDALALVGIDPNDVPRAGGKMLRPALCLMSAGAIGGRKLSDYVQLATAFEALHIASLAHDDVIDRALLRRGKMSLTGLWDNHAAVLGGDYLVARAVEILATYDSCPVVANAIRSVRKMAEGELYFFYREGMRYTRDECLMLAEQKTASLFAEACAAPTFIIDKTHRAALHGFGIALGIAFQIVDDLLDLTQPAATLGKPSCGDIVEGKRTLPILYMREQLEESELMRLDAFHNGEMTDDDRAWVQQRLEATGALQRTQAEARAYGDEALHLLSGLPQTEYRDSMEGLVDFVLVRAM